MTGSTGPTTEGVVLAVVFLVVSVVSTAIQGTSLWRLVRLRATGAPQQVHRGMVRTAICRVAAAASYVAIGVLSLLFRQNLPVLALLVFCGVQVMWQVNAYADLRLRRALNQPSTLEDGGPDA